jgi:hypothetical protein
MNDRTRVAHARSQAQREMVGDRPLDMQGRGRMAMRAKDCQSITTSNALYEPKTF